MPDVYHTDDNRPSVFNAVGHKRFIANIGENLRLQYETEILPDRFVELLTQLELRTVKEAA